MVLKQAGPAAGHNGAARGQGNQRTMNPEGNQHMLKLYVRIKDTIQNLHRREEGQDAFEYMLVIGLVTVAIVTAVQTGLAPTAISTFVTAVINRVTGLIPAP